MEWTGGCLCGAIRYRAGEPPNYASYCHCGMCRKISGAPFTGFVEFPDGVLDWTQGRLEVYRSSEVVLRRFCGTCGQSMNSHDSERARMCHPCGTLVYPRIAPCIITLVTRGQEMLLARNANFPIEMFSTLAGFIEAGESAEECLVREVREEVGVEVENLRYFRSQSGPFPNQLMLGFFADYAGGEIVCEDGEIVEANWYTGDNLPVIPPVHSISGQLIREHVTRMQR